MLRKRLNATDSDKIVGKLPIQETHNYIQTSNYNPSHKEDDNWMLKRFLNA